LIQEFERNPDRYRTFTRVRSKFEDFMLSHRYFATQVVNSYGGGMRRVEAFLALFKTVLFGVQSGEGDRRILDAIGKEPGLKFLRGATPEETLSRKTFSSETKSAVFLRQALEGAPRCQICGARIHKKSISMDHAKRKQDGGDGSPDNAQLTHPYCNTGYKEHEHSKQSRQADQ
jgi:hypothetical protein